MAETRRIKVFLCHAHSDAAAVRDLFGYLRREGVDVWLDKESLLPGADWEFEIRKAVRASDAVVVCLSKQFNQAGFRQKEVRIAIDTALEKPEGEIFIIPARLEECDAPPSLYKWHWVDLFEEGGRQKLIRALRTRADQIGASLRRRKGGQSDKVRPKSQRGVYIIGDAEAIPEFKADERPAEEPPTSAKPDEPVDEIPQILREAGWGQSTGAFDESKSASTENEPASDEATTPPGELPDWVKQLKDTSTAQSSAKDEPPAWLRDLDEPEWLRPVKDASTPSGIWVDEQRNVWRDSENLGTLENEEEYAVLTKLIEHKGEVCRYASLAQNTVLPDWINADAVDARKFLSEHVERIRELIEVDSSYPNYLIEIPGRGYKLRG
jgi:hypothetical protein